MSIEPYGNKFNLVKDGDQYQVADGLKSYKPYFGQYQKWRDKAVQAAKDLVDRNKNALVIGLDVKDFYHSVRIDIDKVNQAIFNGEDFGEYANICSIFSEVLKRYSTHIGIADDQKRVILPIGLISSGVLANYYLDPLDKRLVSVLRPDFYGRYVDDILLVTSCSDDQDVGTLRSLADQYLVRPGIFKNEPDSDLYIFNEEGFETITIQAEKLSVLHFVSSEPTALLDKFLAEIKRNSSEYRLLPEDEVIDYDFNQAAYNLNYSGTGNKLRDIKEFGEDKFGVSKYLAKKIFIALQSGHEPDKEAVQKIVRFFKGRRAIDLYNLWEKVFTFLLVNKDHRAIFDVTRELITCINKLVPGESEEWGGSEYYLEYLSVSLSLAFSLKPSVLKDERFIRKLEYALEGASFFRDNFSFTDSVQAIRYSNLLRHAYVVHPLLNYVGRDKQGDYYDLIDYAQYFKLGSSRLRIDQNMYRFSPRFVHFYEVTLFHIVDRVSSGTSKFYHSGLHFASGGKKSSDKDYLEAAARDFYKLNFIRNHRDFGATNPRYREVSKQLFDLTESSKATNWVRGIGIFDDRPVDRLKVGIANMAIDEEIFSHPYLRRPVIKPVRRKVFNSILNQAEKEGVDLLVLPEVSVPVSWFKWISDHALRQQRAMVFGLEHWVVGNRAFNFIVTLLPFEFDGFKSLAVSIRLKNHYSPAETHLLEGYGYIIPETKNPSYDLYNWRGCHFTAFNCYELSNIEHRSRFRSKVDLLVASEFNKDVAYFSNLVESSARDIHCYIAQSNDSKFGDSRVTQPSSTNTKDLIKVKGGRNPTVLVDTIDLSLLREFQLKEYLGQKDFGVFKPTPPDFDKAEVIKRMKR